MRLFVAVLLGALSLAAPAVAGGDFADATGEVAGSADISTVHVRNAPATGTITFTVDFANLPALTDDTTILLEIDADENPKTGNPLGADYICGLDSGGWYWAKWDAGTQAFVDLPGAKMMVGFARSSFAVVMHDSDIGGARSFDFGVLTNRGTDPNNPLIDVAPNSGLPLYEYDLVQLPQVRSLTVNAGGAAKAGHTFVVRSLSVRLSTGVTTHAAALACTAKLGGHAIRGTGAGRCRYTLPRRAKGKTLVVRVTGSYAGKPVAKTVTYKL